MRKLKLEMPKSEHKMGSLSLLISILESLWLSATFNILTQRVGDPTFLQQNKTNLKCITLLTTIQHQMHFYNQSEKARRTLKIKHLCSKI